jgi:dolichol kinase
MNLLTENMGSGKVINLSASFNFYRKVWHMAGILIPFLFYMEVFDWLKPVIEYPTRTIGIILLILLVIVVFITDLLRLKYPSWQTFFNRFAGHLLKDGEHMRFNATIPYFAANILLMLFFSYELVVLGAVFLMMGDPAAAYAGAKYGKHRFRNGKSMEGLFGFIISSFIFGTVFLLVHTLRFGPHTLMSFSFATLFLVFIGSVAASVAELFSENSFYGLVDDNLLVPIAGASALAFTAYIFFSYPAEALFFNPLILLDQVIQI